MAKFEWDHPQQGRQMQVGWVKIGHFRRKTRYDYLLFKFNSRLEAHAIIYNEKNDVADKN